MSATSKTDWFWSDWLGDQAVRRLTLAERGLWIDLIALAAGANPVGYVCDEKGRPLPLAEIARVTNAGSPDEVAKLIAGILDKGAASRDRSGRLFNRRMVREARLRAKRSRAGKLGASHTNLITQHLFAARRQGTHDVAQHLPRQISRAPPGPFHKENKKTLAWSRQDAARASDAGAQPAPATGAPPGETGQGESGQREQGGEAVAKPPSEVTRAELEALFAAKRGGGCDR